MIATVTVGSTKHESWYKAERLVKSVGDLGEPALAVEFPVGFPKDLLMAFSFVHGTLVAEVGVWGCINVYTNQNELEDFDVISSR